VRKLVDIASKGGNYLLNVGPTAEGVIPQPSVDRLERMGRWLSVYGESIYGTRAGPLHGLDWGRTTQRGRSVYVHVFDWPVDGRLRLDGLGEVGAARMLGGDTLEVRKLPGSVEVRVPAHAPDELDSVIVMERA
jgi:alpha-L-fucosidase